jgi:hypothetical protein
LFVAARELAAHLLFRRLLANLATCEVLAEEALGRAGVEIEEVEGVKHILGKNRKTHSHHKPVVLVTGRTIISSCLFAVVQVEFSNLDCVNVDFVEDRLRISNVRTRLVFSLWELELLELSEAKRGLLVGALSLVALRVERTNRAVKVSELLIFLTRFLLLGH